MIENNAAQRKVPGSSLLSILQEATSTRANPCPGSALVYAAVIGARG